MEIFSAAQCVGYVAFVLGITAFLQKNDRRLKFLLAAETLVYGVHFALLGNPAASVSAFISSGRSLLAMRYRSPVLAFVIVVVNVGLALWVTKSGNPWPPIIGASLSTIAVFLLDGVKMRLTILAATLCWLANNIMSGSIGGTALETLIALANLSTIARLLWSRRTA